MSKRKNLKNLAVVAHVDHGKTTLIDGLLRDSGAFDGVASQERIMDSGELEKEKGITIRAKNCAFTWNDKKINLLDTPGHSDFSGEVERSLYMVDGILLLVDAAEGPLPQTRFVLTKAMEQRKKIAVMINKVDRKDARADEVKDEIEDLFLEMMELTGHDELDLDIPFFYGSAINGWAGKSLEETSDMKELLNFLAGDFYPSPSIDDTDQFKMLVTNLSYSSYLGQMAIGKIYSGEVVKNQRCKRIRSDSEINENFKVSSIQIFDNLGIGEVESAEAGEIVLLAGAKEVQIGDTLGSENIEDTIQAITIDPPTVGVHVSVNTSPFSNKEGEYLTSRQLEEFLIEMCKNNVSIKYEATDDPKVFKLMARGELQLAVIFEELRRKGYEFMLSRPEVVLKEVEGKKLEPFEKLTLDIPSDTVGAITEKLAKRKGIMSGMNAVGENRTRMVFDIPSRGLIGYRSQFLTDTRGEGLIATEFAGYNDYAGDMLSRQSGAIISDRAGKTTPYALFNLLNTGKFFVKPGESCYEGMIIGEHNKTNDANVNCTREKHLSSVRTAGKDVNVVLPPVPPRNLEWALDWIAQDELVEVTPKNIRLRKKALQSNKRSVIRS